MKRVRHRTMPRVKFYPKSKTVPLQAHQAWNILVSQAMMADRRPSKAKIQYGQLRKQMGYPAAGHTLLHALGTIGEFCKANGLPCLNCIVVAKSTRLPGHAVVLREGRTRRQEIKAVVRQDWFEIRPPTVRMFRQVREALYAIEPDDV